VEKWVGDNEVQVAGVSSDACGASNGPTAECLRDMARNRSNPLVDPM